MTAQALTADVAMDRMYRFQRHVYDPTRKYYLLGRDRTLGAMALPPGARALEIGCGTGRNLLRLAALYPDRHLVGVDASAAMLETAARRIAAAGLERRIRLFHCLAENFRDPQGFDAVLFSYSLSMMPSWAAALDRALAHLRPGGALHAVDFWDQAGLPAWFGALLRRWLARFGVVHRPAVLAAFQALAEQGAGRMDLDAVAGRYAYRLRYQPAAARFIRE